MHYSTGNKKCPFFPFLTGNYQKLQIKSSRRTKLLIQNSAINSTTINNNDDEEEY